MVPPMPVKIAAVHAAMGAAVPWPRRASALAAGWDLAAAIDAPVVLAPGDRRAVPLGFRLQLPPGCEAQIRPRSGLALHHGITCLNSPGTIDADYRGEVQAILFHAGDRPFEIIPAMRVAQMVFAWLPDAHLTVAEDPLSDTARGEQGFGSTGQG